ncbi:MAG: hypothetical protein HYW05_03405 [Candidatus Diapherotrites archaeon]|nr:hypothetical protein [Candidatus Diapherotrites archaeon]
MPKLFGAPSRRIRREFEHLSGSKQEKSRTKPRFGERNRHALGRLLNLRRRNEGMLGRAESWNVQELRTHGKGSLAQSLIESLRHFKKRLKRINRGIKRSAIRYNRVEWK